MGCDQIDKGVNVLLGNVRADVLDVLNLRALDRDKTPELRLRNGRQLRASPPDEELASIASKPVLLVSNDWHAGMWIRTPGAWAKTNPNTDIKSLKTLIKELDNQTNISLNKSVAKGAVRSWHKIAKLFNDHSDLLNNLGALH